MATIIELPNEPRYTIKAVASQTGIRPVTLRAWERRHEVLTPHRSEHRYRLYSERDVAILRWLKFRVDEGVSISSAVNELRTMTRNSLWPEAIPQAPVIQPEVSRKPGAQISQNLYLALIKHDEDQISRILQDAHARFPLMDVFACVIQPAVERIEHSFYLGELTASTERFASSYLRGKLLNLLQAYPSRHNAQSILVGCAPMEVHELSSLMLAVLLRSEGYRVEYLGPDINLEDLADYASYQAPGMVVLWANSEFTAREMRRMQSMLNEISSTPFFAYSGKAFTERTDLSKQISGAYLGGSLEENLAEVKNLLKSRPKGWNKSAARAQLPELQ